MFRIVAAKYLVLGEEMQLAREELDATHGVTWDHHSDKTDIYSSLRHMRSICRQIGARSLRKVLDEKIEDGGELKSCDEFDALVETFKRELEDRVFLYIPTADAEFYQNNKLLSTRARTAFPNLTQELRSAGNAYACGLPVACVFHCMRALEHALAALAADVGLKWEKEQWHTIIEQIERRIREEGKTLPMGAAKDERINFLSKAAMECMHFKDGWRNYVVHNRVNYQPEQALEVLEHVQAFTEKLSARLKEIT